MSAGIEQREYNRVLVHVAAVIFLPGVQDDITCFITDVSEQGIGFVLDAKYRDYVSKGIHVGFQFSDSIPLGPRSELMAVTGTMTVLHYQESEGYLHIGGIVKSDKYREYAAKRDMLSYLESGALSFLRRT